MNHDAFRILLPTVFGFSALSLLAARAGSRTWFRAFQLVAALAVMLFFFTDEHSTPFMRFGFPLIIAFNILRWNRIEERYFKLARSWWFYVQMALFVLVSLLFWNFPA